MPSLRAGALHQLGRRLLLASGLALAAAAAFAAAAAAGDPSVTVYVGYADSGPPGAALPARYPAPWQGSPGTVFRGAGPPFDAGAIRIYNPTSATVTLDSVSVDVGPRHYALWGGGLRIPGGGSLILTQTAVLRRVPLQTNFDTSEAAGNTCAPRQPGGVPGIRLSVDGRATTVRDSQRVLDTGGRDLGLCAGRPNESHAWTVAGYAQLGSSSTSSAGPAGAAGRAADLWLAPLTAGLIALATSLPALAAGLLLLLLGWLLGGWLGGLAAGLVDRLGFGAAAERTGLFALVGVHRRRAADRSSTAGWLAAGLVRWFVFLVFVELAAAALHLGALLGLLTRIALWIPNLLAALAIVLAAGVLAQAAGRLVQGASAEAGVGDPTLLANTTRLALLGFGLIVAADQLGLAGSLITILFAGTLAALGLALALAFGLGGSATAAALLRAWLEDWQDRPQPPPKSTHRRPA